MKHFLGVFLCLLLFVFPSSACANDEAFQILLLGTDDFGLMKVESGATTSRADAIFVASFHPGTGAIRLLSIERDYLVELPDGLGKNKLATSSFFGGPKLTMQAVNTLFGTNIRYYAQVDINSIIKVVDLLGGIDVEVFESEVEELNLFINAILSYEGLSEVSAGMNHLGGPEAWAFMGVRDNTAETAASNADRNDRQSRALAAMLNRAKAMSPNEMREFVGNVIPLVQTNMTAADGLRFIQAALACDVQNLQYLYSPTGAYRTRRVNMHAVVVPEDMEMEQKKVIDYLSGGGN